MVALLFAADRVVMMRCRDWDGGLDWMNSSIRRVQVARPSPLQGKN